MFRTMIFGFLMVAVCLGAGALTGSGNSETGPLETVTPTLALLIVVPAQAAAGDTVTITFMASETLGAHPVVTVNGHAATFVSGAKTVAYTYSYVVAETDVPGMANVSVWGADLVGNRGTLSSSTAFEIIEALEPVPLHTWPLALLMVAAGIAAIAWRRRRLGVLLLAMALLATPGALAASPAVSNVTFAQSPNGTTGTKVDIYNGPCAITLSLSKDGGADGFSYPIANYTGDIANVNTGPGHIVWDIYADYAEQNVPLARIRVTADDGIIPLPVVTSFLINSGASTTTDPLVTLDNTVTNSPTDYMASEAADFAGASWTAYTAAPSFTLSAGAGGVKTVYFKVKNADGESGVVNDTISLTERTILLPGSVPLELVWVPSGSFQMVRYAGEADSYAREDPQHGVTLAQGFWMGKHEITQQQWIAVRGTWPGTAPSTTYGLGDTYPAYYVSWDDTKNFITSLNAHIVSSGQGPLTVRLPSEAEWEYACRAGTQTRFYFGDSLGCAADCSDCAAGVMPGNRSDYMWYCGNNSPNGSKAVGGKTPNAFGLYDMSGNVFEWCEDDYHSNYTGAPANGSAWIGSPRALFRMLRGGHWYYSARYCRSAFRYFYTPGSRSYYFGFRVAAVQ